METATYRDGFPSDGHSVKETLRPDVEYNTAIVNAYSSKFGGPGVDIGYELLSRPVGKRKWNVVGRTQDWQEASDWAARSGYKIRKPRN